VGRVSTRIAAVAALLVMSAGVPAPLRAQGDLRLLTTIAAIRQYPSVFHLQSVVVRGELVEGAVGVVLEADGRRLDVALGNAGAPTGPVEVRGRMVDVGRLEPNDPRLGGFQPPDPDRWPQRNELLLLLVDSVAPADPAVTPTIRALALEPWRFEGESVSVTGQFRGRNLYGDLPGAPAASEYDFVLRSAGASLWVTNLEPKGRGFELRVTARVDTGRWVRVTGVVHHERGLVTITGAAIAEADPPSESDEPDDGPAPAPLLVPAEAVFSIPTGGETGVSRDLGTVRLQFSRGLDPLSVRDGIRVRYDDGDQAVLEVQTRYDAATSSLAVTLPGRLDPFRRVVVETLDGLRAFDGAPVTPFTLTFTTGQ